MKNLHYTVVFALMAGVSGYCLAEGNSTEVILKTQDCDNCESNEPIKEAEKVVEKKSEPASPGVQRSKIAKKVILPPPPEPIHTKVDLQSTLFAGLVPTVGLGLFQDVTEHIRVEFTYQAGEIALPKSQLSGFNNEYWTVSSAKLQQQAWTLGTTFRFWTSGLVGFGYKQKRNRLLLKSEGVESDTFDFKATGTIWTQGLYTHLGQRFVLSSRLQLEIIWLGFDIPLQSSYELTVQNGFVAAEISDLLLSQSPDYKTFINSIRHRPWPYFFMFNLTLAVL